MGTQLISQIMYWYVLLDGFIANHFEFGERNEYA